MKNYVNLPDDYREILQIDLQKDKRLALIVNGIALLIIIVMAIIGHFFVPITELLDGTNGINWSAIFVGMIVYMILHELIHGIAMKAYSKQKPFYGFTGMYAYAGSNSYFNKKSYLVIALAPIVVWGIVLLILNLIFREWFWVIYFIQIANISGAAGDLYVAERFSKLPKDILVKDIGVNMTVYSKEHV